MSTAHACFCVTCTLYLSGDRCIHCSLSLSIQNGWSPLMIACHGGHEVVVQELIRKGAKLNTENKVGYHRVS